MAFGMQARQKRVASIESSLAPLGGINDIDPLANMPPESCIQLNDWFPGTTGLVTRRGYKEYAINLTGTVRTIMEMATLGGEYKTLAATDSGVYDITTPIDTPPIAYALSSGALSYTQFSNVAGQYLICANGVDPAFLYDSSSFITFTQVASPVNPGEISGLDPTLISHVTSFKGRVWLVEKDSMNAYYLDTDAVGGVLTPFYLGGIFHEGGYLFSIDTWSLDAGNGLDDKLVFRSSNGEVAIYAGNNPNDAADWALEGRYYVSPPVGKLRGAVDVGGDLLMLTQAGLIPLSKVVQGVANIALYENAISKNLSRTLSSLANSPYFQSNWELVNLSQLQAILIVIPATPDKAASQFIMNTLTGKWAKYNLPTTCVGVSGRNIFLGDIGRAHIFNTVGLDGVDFAGEGGVAVVSTLFSAFNYFDSRGTIKHWKLIRPIFQSSKPVSCLTKLAIDYDLTPIAGNPYPPDRVGEWYLWNEAIWNEAYWGSFNTLTKQWRGVTGVGFCAALLMKVSSDTEVTFSACDVVYEKGRAI